MKIILGDDLGFDCLQTAIAFLENQDREPTEAASEIWIPSGFEVAEQLFLSDRNLSWITIKAEDEFVPVRLDSLRNEFEGRYPFLAGRNSRLPRIEAHFRFTGEGLQRRRDGLYLSNGSHAYLAKGAGFSFAGQIGVFVNEGSFLDAAESRITDSPRNLHVTRNSMANVQQADLSRSTGTRGLNVSLASTVNAFEAEIRNCVGEAIACTNASRVNAQRADCSGASRFGLNCINGGFISFSRGNALCGVEPSPSDIRVFQGGIIQANRARGGTSQMRNTITADGIIFG